MGKRFLGLTPDGRRRYAADYIVPPPAPAGGGGDPAINDEVDQGSDDAFEVESSGNVNADHGSLWIVQSGAAARYWGGLRFRSPTGVDEDPDEWPAQGSTIDVAHAEVYLYTETYDDSRCDIHAQDAAGPVTFVDGDANFDITGRSRTTAFTPWLETALGIGWAQTPSLVDVIQELVTDYTITTIVLIFKPRTDLQKQLYARNFAEGHAAKLHLEWAEGPNTYTRAHETDALLQATFTRAHEIDAFLVDRLARTHETDALLRATFVRAHETDALLRATFIGAHETDAFLVPMLDYRLEITRGLGPKVIISGEAMSVEAWRGRDFDSAVGRWVPGQLSVLLLNDDGKYTPSSEEDPLYNELKPGSPLEFSASRNGETYIPLWSGVVSEITPSAPAGLHTVRLRGVGGLSILEAAKDPELPAAVEKTGPWIQYIVLSVFSMMLTVGADWDDGLTTTGIFYPEEGVTALELVRQMEDCEPGLVYEYAALQMTGGPLWYRAQLGYEDRHHRLLATRSQVSQATFSDDPEVGLHPTQLEVLKPLTNIHNSAQATVLGPAIIGGIDVLWRHLEPISLRAGAVVYLTARYPTAAIGGDEGAYVNPWTTPVVGTDIIAHEAPLNAYLEIDNVIKSANTMRFRVRNKHSWRRIWVNTTQARGLPWAKEVPMAVSAEDTDSIEAYGLRAYPLPPLWLPGIEAGQDFCDYIVSRHKDSHMRLRLTFVASRDAASMAQALTGLIGDRVTLDMDGVSGLGVNEDFYIENIRHAIDQGKTRHIVTYEVISCSGEGAYWVLDHSPLERDDAHLLYPTTRLEY